MAGKYSVIRFSIGVLLCGIMLMTPIRKISAEPRADSSGRADIESLRAQLFSAGKDDFGLSVPEHDPGLQAITTLEKIGSNEAVMILREYLTTADANRKLKQLALAALGRIGTRPAVDAIKAFEKWSNRQWSSPPPFQFGPRDYAIDHFSAQDLQPAARCTDLASTEWAVFRWDGPLGRWNDLWITHRMKGDVWSQPVYLDLPALTHAGRIGAKITYGLKFDSKGFVLKANDKSQRFTLAQQLKDTDGDKLPDAFERRLGTDPKKRDSDGDGILDGRDQNPLTPKKRVVGDTVEIRQAVFSIAFSTSNSRNTIIALEDKDRSVQEFHGYGGYVVRSPKIRGGFVNLTGMDLKSVSRDRAIVDLGDYEGGEAASGHQVTLAKRHGKWVVTGYQMTWIS